MKARISEHPAIQEFNTLLNRVGRMEALLLRDWFKKWFEIYNCVHHFNHYEFEHFEAVEREVKRQFVLENIDKIVQRYSTAVDREGAATFYNSIFVKSVNEVKNGGLKNKNG